MAIRRRRTSRKSVGQMELIPEIKRQTPQEFAKMLYKKGLITKTSKGKNVLKDVANAYNRLIRLREIDLKAFVKALNEPELSAGKILRNTKIIKPITRSPTEEKSISIAVTTIVKYVNRKRAWKDWMKEYGPSMQERLQEQAEKKHIKSISDK